MHSGGRGFSPGKFWQIKRRVIKITPSSNVSGRSRTRFPRSTLTSMWFMTRQSGGATDTIQKKSPRSLRPPAFPSPTASSGMNWSISGKSSASGTRCASSRSDRLSIRNLTPFSASSPAASLLGNENPNPEPGLLCLPWSTTQRPFTAGAEDEPWGCVFKRGRRQKIPAIARTDCPMSGIILARFSLSRGEHFCGSEPKSQTGEK